MTTAGILVFDNVLTDPEAYRAEVLKEATFQSLRLGDHTFHGVSLSNDPYVPQWIESQYPQLKTWFSFIRRSPKGQAEPNYVHSDGDMGDWTGILYLNPKPVSGDGTRFWKHKITKDIKGDVATYEKEWADQSLWEPWHLVPAQFGRLLLFHAPLFHSRALEQNYGKGSTARLVQVVFGSGTFPELP